MDKAVKVPAHPGNTKDLTTRLATPFAQGLMLMEIRTIPARKYIHPAGTLDPGGAHGLLVANRMQIKRAEKIPFNLNKWRGRSHNQ
jgi:hypothetical protein